jgi:hypothetical protein
MLEIPRNEPCMNYQETSMLEIPRNEPRNVVGRARCSVLGARCSVLGARIARKEGYY